MVESKPLLSADHSPDETEPYTFTVGNQTFIAREVERRPEESRFWRPPVEYLESDQQNTLENAGLSESHSSAIESRRPATDQELRQRITNRRTTTMHRLPIPYSETD